TGQSDARNGVVAQAQFDGQISRDRPRRPGHARRQRHIRRIPRHTSFAQSRDGQYAGRHPRHTRAAPGARPDRNLGIQLSGMATILLVDERDANRAVLAALLRQKGHRLLETADPAEVKDILRTERPDVVVTDVLMVAMSAFPLALLHAGAEGDRPCFILTAPEYLIEEARRLANASGASHVIAKPFEPHVLLELISKAAAEPPAAQLERPVPDQSAIESHLCAIFGAVRRHVTELEEMSRKLELRVVESTSQLETARAALKEEVF